MTESRWVLDHNIHLFARTEFRPDSLTEGERWMERRQTGKVMVVCSCGYSSAPIDHTELRPLLEQLADEHTPDLTAQYETPYGPRAAVAAWLRANGINPDDVPVEGPITIDEQQIRYTAMLRNETGHHYVDDSTGEAAREARTAPLATEPPADVRIKGGDVYEAP